MTEYVEISTHAGERWHERRDESPGYGPVTYARFLREGRRLGDEVGIYELDNPIAGIEIRDPDDLPIWDRLREVEDLLD